MSPRAPAGDISQIAPRDTEPLAAATFLDFVTSGPASARAAVGARAARIAGAVAVSVPGDPTGAWTRVVGLGIAGPLSAAVLEDLRRFYAADGEVTVTLTIAASVLPGDWEALRDAHGLVGVPGGHKLALDLHAPVPPPTRSTLAPGLRVGAVDSGSALQLGTLMTDVFQMRRAPLAAMVAGVLDRDGWQGFGVWDRGELVAGALMRITGAWAHLIGTTTLPHARNRGAQTALTRARLDGARAAGCRWAMVEIDGDPDGRGCSFRNMRAAGFRPTFAYPSWSWSP